ncbi:ABC transporter ATP-binding protein [Marisediminicola sp. LYQ134]|uniref:ABC transporter ATP-binding protein n=1 Tax=unclassified Marisediminicola TaxID=2618316 RepID=UPI0039833B23
MSAHLTLDCVSKSFSDAHAPALDGVTLTVAASSCTAILGPSGSGKSTILRVMAGLDHVSDGQVLVDGKDVAGLAPERRGMGMVFQRPLLFPHLSVLDNVAFADRVAGVPRATARSNAERYLEMVQLGGYGKRPITALSGGQEQRVAIARALAAKPDVLLLDEPFSALDPALREDMHVLIGDIREALAPTIVLVTHDRDEASAVADQIAILHEGELLQHDTVDRIYNRPASVRVARLMGGANEVAGEVRGGVHHSALGAVELGDAVDDGPGVLVVRQEALGVRSSDGAVGGDEVEGTVADIRHLGPRRILTIAFGPAGEVRLGAELPPGQGVAVGSSVTVRLPRAAVSVVPAGR